MATISHRATDQPATVINGRQFVRAVKSDRVQQFLDKADAYGSALLKRGRDHSRPFTNDR
jgi:hypothetical protein